MYLSKIYSKEYVNFIRKPVQVILFANRCPTGFLHINIYRVEQAQ